MSKIRVRYEDPRTGRLLVNAWLAAIAAAVLAAFLGSSLAGSHGAMIQFQWAGVAAVAILVIAAVICWMVAASLERKALTAKAEAQQAILATRQRELAEMVAPRPAPLAPVVAPAQLTPAPVPAAAGTPEPPPAYQPAAAPDVEPVQVADLTEIAVGK